MHTALCLTKRDRRAAAKLTRVYHGIWAIGAFFVVLYAATLRRARTAFFNRVCEYPCVALLVVFFPLLVAVRARCCSCSVLLLLLWLVSRPLGARPSLSGRW